MNVTRRKKTAMVIFCLIVFFACPLTARAQGRNTVAAVPVPGAALTGEDSSLALSGQGGESGKGLDAGEAKSAGDVPMASREFVRLGWEASSRGDLERIETLVEECLRIYGREALEQEAGLQAFPPRAKEKEYQALNDVATLLFIRAEAYMNYGRRTKAIALFQEIIDNYPWAQAWDPRGWFWSVAEKSQNSIDVMMGKVEEFPDEPEKGLRTMPRLAFKGREDVIDYKKYGEFVNVGTPDYHYRIIDQRGLSEAVGEAIYPNTGAILKDPGYKKAKDEGRLEGSHWDFIQTDDLEAALYKWATAKEPYGIRLFYIGLIFERAGMYLEAIKAYHAIVVHFPRTVSWTYWHTPWYPAQAAVARIKYLVRTHPELELKVKWMKVEVINGFDNNIRNDRIKTYPGVVRKRTMWDRLKERWHLESSFVKLDKIKRKVGEGKVQLVQYENGHWQMLVDGEPYVIRGVNYAPTKVGQSPDKKTLVAWMYEDGNHNGLPDGPFDSWIDKNANNQRDPDEPVVGDFQLMKDMGVNTIREYHQPTQLDKPLLRRMFEEYGFRVIMGDYFGKYTLGSGASWFEGTDYENPEHQKRMMDSVRKMVMEHKDEPYILLWVLGNENNYGVASNADEKPEAYFKFANQVAKMIKSIDPDHPVAICNGDTLFLDVFAQNAPDVDIFAANVYRGDYGFGSFWREVANTTGRPAFITEYGCPAYAKHMTRQEAEKAQSDYHRGNWLDIESNMAGRIDGAGNALGGVIFEWMDEWWKSYEPFYHDRKSDAIGPFPGGYYYEEWFGIIGQGNGVQSPFLRQLREAYFAYKEMWEKFQ